jgi:hypothetical protein
MVSKSSRKIFNRNCNFIAHRFWDHGSRIPRGFLRDTYIQNFSSLGLDAVMTEKIRNRLMNGRTDGRMMELNQ